MGDGWDSFPGPAGPAGLFLSFSCWAHGPFGRSVGLAGFHLFYFPRFRWIRPVGELQRFGPTFCLVAVRPVDGPAGNHLTLRRRGPGPLPCRQTTLAAPSPFKNACGLDESWLVESINGPRSREPKGKTVPGPHSAGLPTSGRFPLCWGPEGPPAAGLRAKRRAAKTGGTYTEGRAGRTFPLLFLDRWTGRGGKPGLGREAALWEDCLGPSGPRGTLAWRVFAAISSRAQKAWARAAWKIPVRTDGFPVGLLLSAVLAPGWRRCGPPFRTLES